MGLDQLRDEPEPVAHVVEPNAPPDGCPFSSHWRARYAPSPHNGAVLWMTEEWQPDGVGWTMAGYYETFDQAYAAVEFELLPIDERPLMWRSPGSGMQAQGGWVVLVDPTREPYFPCLRHDIDDRSRCQQRWDTGWAVPGETLKEARKAVRKRQFLGAVYHLGDCELFIDVPASATQPWMTAEIRPIGYPCANDSCEGAYLYVPGELRWIGLPKTDQPGWYCPTCFDEALEDAVDDYIHAHPEEYSLPIDEMVKAGGDALYRDPKWRALLVGVTLEDELFRRSQSVGSKED